MSKVAQNQGNVIGNVTTMQFYGGGKARNVLEIKNEILGIILFVPSNIRITINILTQYEADSTAAIC